MDDVPFFELNEGDFPMKLEFFNEAGALVHTIDIPGPGSVHIPALAVEHGPVTCVVTYPHGIVVA